MERLKALRRSLLIVEPKHFGVGVDLLKNTLPAITTNLTVLLVGLVELHVAGLLGTAALEGIVVAFVWVSMMFSFSLGAYTIGVTRTVVARGRIGLTRTAFHTAVWVGAGTGLGFAACVFAGAELLLAATGLRGEGLRVGAQFLHISSFGFPAIFVLGAAQGLLRGTGRASAASFLVNLPLWASAVLLPLLALPQYLALQHVGLALATVLPMLIGAVVAGHLAFRSLVKGHEADAGVFDRRFFSETMSITYPSGLVWLIVSISAAFVQHVMAQFGPHHLAGFGIVMRLETVIGVVASAFGVGLLYVASSLVATGRQDRLLLVLRAQQGLFIAFVLPPTLYFWVEPVHWGQWFSTDKAVVTAAAENARYFVLGLPFMGLAQLTAFALIALGKPLQSLSVIVVKNFVLMVPLTLVAAWMYPVWPISVLFCAQVMGAPLAWVYAEWLLGKQMQRKFLT